MKLSKSIEILDDLALYGNVHLDEDDVDALKLGIEALKAIEQLRNLSFFNTTSLLPGEEPE